MKGLTFSGLRALIVASLLITLFMPESQDLFELGQDLQIDKFLDNPQGLAWNVKTALLEGVADLKEVQDLLTRLSDIGEMGKAKREEFERSASESRDIKNQRVLTALKTELSRTSFATRVSLGFYLYHFSNVNDYDLVPKRGWAQHGMRNNPDIEVAVGRQKYGITLRGDSMITSVWIEGLGWMQTAFDGDEV